MSDHKKGKKRSKSYYIKCAGGGKKFKHANDLAAGMKGFLVTCNKYEKETVREMYNILNEYADQMYGPEVKEVETNDSGSEEEDMEKAMAKETSAIKESANKERRFQNTDTKAKNCIFIRTNVESPCELAHNIFTDVVTKQVQKARYALRMLPISVTCKTNMPNIKEAAEAMLKPHFETDFGIGLKFTSVCKIRNNQSVSRTVILPTLGKIVQELNPLHRLCHDEPDLVIIVEVIRNICCMSVVKDYFKFKKYNFHEVLKKTDTCGKEGNVQGENTMELRIKPSEETKEETVLEKEVTEIEKIEPGNKELAEKGIDETETCTEACKSDENKMTQGDEDDTGTSVEKVVDINKDNETGNGKSENRENESETPQTVTDVRNTEDEVTD